MTGISFDANLRADAIGARRVLDAAGHTGLTLLELAREAARKPAVDQRSRVLMAPLVEDFLESQRRDNRAGSTVRNLAVRIAAWITRERIGTLADVTDATLLALKQRRNVSAQTRINDMAAVSSLLSWVVNERRLLPVNPLTSISRPTVDVRVPRVLEPEQARALLEAARTQGEGRLLRYFVLCLLAGLRPSEAARVNPQDVMTGRDGFVRVIKSKRRRRLRQVAISAAFRAWWKAAPETPMPLYDQDRDRALFDAIRESAGLIQRGRGGDRKRLVGNRWQNDICRHTWISLRLHQTKDEAAVALEAGTSVQQIHEHYLDWLTPAAARALAALRPQALGSKVDQQG
ncbi:MAG: hypothetical protein JSS23_12360 [Proteobacteria bacterium]|nr:hypothetical protein [Pseudomonadota bacterium]